MPDWEKVIAGLEECLELLNCIGTQNECKNYVSDAIALLKEQEAEIYKLQKELNYWQYTGIKESW